MSTRAMITIKEDNKTVCKIYHHWDGYPRGLGRDIKTILNDGKFTVVDGYGGDKDCPKEFNGAGCLAAYLVSQLKLRATHERKGGVIGNVYIVAANAGDMGQEYEYIINVDTEFILATTTLTIKSGRKTIFKGAISRFNPTEVQEREAA